MGLTSSSLALVLPFFYNSMSLDCFRYSGMQSLFNILTRFTLIFA